MSRASKMYSKSPKLERDEDGKMGVKTPEKAQEIEAGVQGVDGKGGGSIPAGIRHSHERIAMHHRHIHEHLEMHRKHEMEHAHHKGDKKELHERHEKEYAEMHAKHHGEMKKLHAKQEGEHSKEMKSEEKGDAILNKATKGGEGEKE